MNRIASRTAILLACLGLSGEARAGFLGAAGSFAVLGGTTVTNTGLSTLAGNVGVAPGTSITGFPPGVVTGGSIHADDTLAIQAQADAATASATLSGLAATRDLSGQNLGGLTLTPGVYHFASSAQLTGLLTLDGLGEADPQFVFQVGSTLTTATASSVSLIDGATPGNVFFRVGDSATLGVGTRFVGTIIASQSDTLGMGVEVDGRIIALNGAVTLDTDRIASPSTVPEPSSLAMCGVAVAISLLVVRVRHGRLARTAFHAIS